jgi:ABC-2 type transport system ATP-binding protein
VRTILQRVKAQGATVFLNSHLLSEVEVTCDRVAFIKEGTVLRTLALRELADARVHLIVRVDQVTPALLERFATLSDEWRFLENREDGAPTPEQAQDEADWPTRIELVTSEAQLPVIAREIVAVGAQLYEFTPQRPSLEQLFLDIVGREDSGQ